MCREVRWERMFPDELEAAFQACPVVYFAYGLCEPHGPHNTLGLDALKAHAVACAAARAHGGIVAPPDYWHVHEIGTYALWAWREVGEVDRNWTTAMPPWQHFRNVCYHVRCADSLGFHAAIFLTGHYGPNWQDLKTLLALLQPYCGTRLYGLPDFEANTPGFDGDGRSGGDHAGRVETSLLWALEPECVDVSRLPAPTAPGPHFAMGANARESSRVIGQRMAADEVRWLGEKARALREEYARLRPEHRFTTFAEVERVWRDVVKPAVAEFECMKMSQGDGSDMPPESVWNRNCRIPEWE
jgi:creatinine amidohydrolase